jgi:hypothetical protein
VIGNLLVIVRFVVDADFGGAGGVADQGEAAEDEGDLAVGVRVVAGDVEVRPTGLT